ncbi:SnoaL-like domain-containing protein [Sphingobium sp. YR768]|nr:SnoaL-like domain-containing protein [Sphingobium sp. YR768]
MRRALEMRDAGICGPGSATRHIVSTPEVIPDPTDPDSATVIAFVAMGGMREGKASFEGYGEYTDLVRKVDGIWYMVKR